LGKTFEAYKENRLAKLRLGQAAGEIVTLTGAEDEDETRFVIVPLTDGENLKAFSLADEMEVTDTSSGLAAKDEMLKRALIFFAARELHDWTEPFFDNIEDVAEVYDHDINHAYDIYLEMISTASPAWALLGDDEIEELKKVWSRIELKELSGAQQYAAQRFLNSIRPLLLRASYFGSPSTQKLTGTNEEPQPAESA
jgi:hypothetical protein